MKPARRRQLQYDNGLYVEFKKKNDANELIYKTETDVETLEKKCMVIKGEGWGGGID